MTATLDRIYLPGSGEHKQFTSDYTGLWAIQPMHMRAGLDFVRQSDIAAHVADVNISGGPKCAASMLRVRLKNSQANGATQPDQGPAIAVIEIRGVMMKRASSMMESSSTIRVRKMVREAANDPAIGGIMLVIDSPGGTVAGTEDLANEIRRAAGKKPVWAHVQDCMCSAAVWAGMQASRITASARTADIGSIGVLIALYDFSKQAEQEGIEAVVIKTGERKGLGFPGKEVTEGDRAYLQRQVDRTAQVFNDAIRHRVKGETLDRMTRTAETVDADEATELGIIEGIESFEDAVKAMFDKLTATQGGTMQKGEYSGQDVTLDVSAGESAGESAGNQVGSDQCQDDQARRDTEQIQPTGESQNQTESAQSASKSAKSADDEPATLAWLEANCTQASAEFRLDCLRDRCTKRKATERYIAQLQSDAEKERAAREAAEQRIKAGESAGQMGGGEAIDTGTDTTAETRPGQRRIDPHARLSDVIQLPSRAQKSDN